MNINYPRFLTGVLLLATTTTASFAQEEEKKEEDMYVLSLEQLMNIPIKSASKKEETLFDAPLSGYTITRAEIDKAGSTSIMEALRLSPGVIVREQTNGTYDIHIRGMENLSRTNGQFLKSDAYTLVMIDNRPVFNHGLGGTFWESLPVDINDVDRIEIVRGPSSPLFGPNAVTGVINIITKRLSDSKTLVNANVQAGNIGTSIANISVGKTLGKFSSILTANYQDRQRVDKNYYDDATGNYVPLSTLGQDQDDAVRAERYPHPTRALNKWGVNGYFTYKFSEKINVDLSLSRQLATGQRFFVGNQLEYSRTDNSAANLAATIYGLKVRSSYLKGFNSDVRHGFLGGPAYLYGDYDFKIADAMAEYDIKIGSNYTITPGVSIQSVKFDDSDYANPAVGKIGYFNAPHTLTTNAGFIRSDLNFTKKLRVIAAIRADHFSVPDTTYLAYEFAGTYKFNANHLVRIAVTRSNSGSFMGYNYLNLGPRVGDSNLKIFTLSMIEIGYRTQITKNLQVDLDIFHQSAENLTVIITQSPTSQKFSNVPTTAVQNGATLSVNFVPNDKIQFKPFITLQRTETKDLPVDPLGDPSYYSSAFAESIGSSISYANSTHKYTPSSYGGFYFNYRPVPKLNVNLNTYYLGKQQGYDATWKPSDTSTEQYKQGQIKGKFVGNVKVSYEIAKGLTMFVNARSLGSDSREFFAGDRTTTFVVGGASFNFNK